MSGVWMTVKHLLKKSWVAVVFLAVLSALVLILPLSCTVFAEGVDLSAEQEAQLVERFAPVLYFHPDESVFPVNISYFLSCANLMEYSAKGPRLLEARPSPDSLGQYTSSSNLIYLDDFLGGIHDSAIVDSYRENESSLGYDVYAHVTTDGNYMAVQYWFFYVFNDGYYNHHEGDWEMIEVILDASLEPSMAAYSQHESGDSAKWESMEIVDGHPVVYVGKGSHANFFHLEKGTIGLGRDVVGNDGRVLRPDDYTINIIGLDGARGTPGWVDFSGRWGEWSSGTAEMLGKNGPPGPAHRMDGAMWSGVSWAGSVSGNATSTQSGSSSITDAVMIIAIVTVVVMIGYGTMRWKKI